MALRLALISVLLLALAPLPIGYYTFLRIVVCGGSVYLFFTSTRGKWKWMWGTLAIVFNPLIPLYLGRNLWQIVDVVAALVIGADLMAEKAARSKPEG